MTTVKEYKLSDFQGFLLEDGPIEMDPRKILDKYFSDIYRMFLNRMFKFSLAESISEDEEKRLKHILDELFKIKRMSNEKLPDDEGGLWS